MKTENIEMCINEAGSIVQGKRFFHEASKELTELKRLAEIGERLYGPGECAKKKTCFRNSPCYGAACCDFVTAPEIGEKIVADQQLAKEKLAFWGKAFLSTVHTNDNGSGYDTECADAMVDHWLSRRGKFGVR